MSCAKPPISAPLFSARIALAEIAPKLIDDTLTSAMLYGLRQSGPPTITRGGLSGASSGVVLCTRYSYPGW